MPAICLPIINLKEQKTMDDKEEDCGQDCPTAAPAPYFDAGYLNAQARAEALRLAVGRPRHGASSAEEIVKDAQTFADFLIG